VVGDEEHAAEAFEREALEACLELPWGGGDCESSSFASSLDSVRVIVLGAHFRH